VPPTAARRPPTNHRLIDGLQVEAARRDILGLYKETLEQ